MSKIRSKDTKPEMIIRKNLHGMGYRYRLHIKDLPGKPDIYLPKYKTVIEVMGCFWHGHNCHLGSSPNSNKDYWVNKITRNKERDLLNKKLILEKGLDLLVVWECSIMGKTSRELGNLLGEIESFITDSRNYHEIQGMV